jgi:hypothetical protein
MRDKREPKAPEVAGPFDSRQMAMLNHDHELVIARYSPCGKFLFAGSYDSNIYRWQLRSAEAANNGTSSEQSAGTNKTTVAGHKAWVQGIEFHPDKKRMFTGDSWGTLICWDYASAEPKPAWTRDEGHTRWMRSMAISPDGQLLATCGADRIVKLWSTSDGSPKWESPAQEYDLHSVQFHPTGDLVVGDLRGNITQWDLSAKKVARKLDAHVLYLKPTFNGVPDINDVGGVRRMSFDREGKFLACCGAQPVSSGFFTSKPTIVLIDWASGTSQTLQWDGVDPADGITLDVIWHPDGYLIACSSGQAGHGALYCWKPGTKVPSYLDKKMFNCRSLAGSADGKMLAVAQVHQQAGRAGNGRHAAQSNEYLGFAGSIRIFESVKV